MEASRSLPTLALKLLPTVIGLLWHRQNTLYVLPLSRLLRVHENNVTHLWMLQASSRTGPPFCGRASPALLLAAAPPPATTAHPFAPSMDDCATYCSLMSSSFLGPCRKSRISFICKINFAAT